MKLKNTISYTIRLGGYRRNSSDQLSVFSDQLNLLIILKFLDIELSMCTGRTDTENEYLMAFDHKTVRNGKLLAQIAARKLKDAIAGMAVEIMMVFLVCPLVYRTKQGMIDAP